MSSRFRSVDTSSSITGRRHNRIIAFLTLETKSAPKLLMGPIVIFLLAITVFPISVSSAYDYHACRSWVNLGHALRSTIWHHQLLFRHVYGTTILACS